MGFSVKKMFGGDKGIMSAMGAVVNPVSLLGTGLAVGADLYGAKQEADAAERANRTNINLTHEQMRFQERMSSTAHQREVEDLRKAGLNPLMSLNAGASSPAGSMTDVDPVPSVVARAASSAKDSMRLAQEMRAAHQQIKESRSRIQLQKEQEDAARASAENQRSNAKLNDAEFFRQSKENEFIQKNEWYLPTLRMIQLIGSGVSTARDAAIGYRGVRGLGPEVSETFGSGGEHKRTTIRSRR